MSLEESILNLLSNYNLHTPESIIRKLKQYNEPVIIDTLFELEKQGKIYFDGQKYMKVPTEFFLTCGVLKISNRGNFYIERDDKKQIIIKPKDLDGSKVGDTVFVEQFKNGKHKNNYTGKVRRIVKRPIIKENTYIIKDTIKRKPSGEYFIMYNNKEIFIPTEYLNGAFNQDVCSIRLIHKDNKFIGRVVNIIISKNDSHLYKCMKRDGKILFVPLYTSYKEYHLKENIDIEEGEIILAQNSDTNEISFIRKLDNNEILESKINAIALSHGYDGIFTKEEMEEANSIDTNISEEEIAKRCDFRDLLTVSIDPIGAKDMDDAISVEILKDRIRVYAHISDVSHYVKLNSKLFLGALRRGFSAYALDKCWPMLPNILADDICSLNPNVDRLCKTDIIDIDFNGNVIDYRVCKSVIRSNCKMTYTNVNKYYEDGVVVPDYEPFTGLLNNIRIAGMLIDKIKSKRNILKVKSSESEYKVKDGSVISVAEKEEGIAEHAVANIMSLANELNTGFLRSQGADLLLAYRNHERLTEVQLASLKRKLPHYNHQIDKIIGNTNIRNASIMLNKLLESCSDEEANIVSKLVLTSLNEAYFSSINKGHYGLDLECYATHTSAIRKCTDIINQHNTDCVLNGDFIPLEVLDDTIEDICTYLSDREREAEAVEKETDLVLLNDYISSFAGQELDAKITFITDRFIYIKTNNNIHGVIPCKGKLKIYRDKIIDIKTNESYSIGDNIKVVIDEANNNHQTIFKLLHKKEMAKVKKIGKKE